MNRRHAYIVSATALALFVGVSAARGNVIDPKMNKTAAKLRADIGKQGTKYVACLVKAATKCEKKGVDATVECHLNTGVVDYDSPPGKATTKFQDAIAKCDGKYNPSKKGSDYVAIGCPGDCGAAPGIQECANISPAYEATVESTTLASAAKAQLPTLASLINVACGTDLGNPPMNDPGRIACVGQNAATLGAYGQGLFKCAGKCEEDFKGTKGGGGSTNGPNCLSGDPGRDPAFDACDTAAFNSAVSKNGMLSASNNAILLPAVRSAINIATTGLYDRSDPTSSDPAASPCGNCGNGVREGAEECDGADDGECGVSCNPDCTCNP